MPRVCSTCMKGGRTINLRPCHGGCGHAYYCGRECHLLHWMKNHRCTEIQVVDLVKPRHLINYFGMNFRMCNNCHKIELRGNMQFCINCRQAYYCDRACQKAHWERSPKSHKESCDRLRRELDDYVEDADGNIVPGRSLVCRGIGNDNDEKEPCTLPGTRVFCVYAFPRVSFVKEFHYRLCRRHRQLSMRQNRFYCQDQPGIPDPWAVTIPEYFDNP